jgi:hypothetical protein
MRRWQPGERRDASSQLHKACRTLALFLFAGINYEWKPANREAQDQQYRE